MPQRYTDLNSYLRRRFGCRVQKISVDAGFTCPNRDGTLATGGCIYCNARGSGTGAHARGLSITEQLLAGKQALTRRYKAEKFIAYFQAFSNTYAPLPLLQKRYAEALEVPGVVGLAIGTRPDCVDEAVLELLQKIARRHLVWIEYGLQSAHDATLARINRGHDVAAFQSAVAATRGRGLEICAHVILGLPGEKRREMLKTAEFLAGLELDAVKIHLLYVVRGTALETLWRQGQYRCLRQQEYVGLVCDFLERLPPAMVIQRLTGDPRPGELVAPQWARYKQQTLNHIRETLVARDTWQGKYYRPQHRIAAAQSMRSQTGPERA
jgi:radical SAM protein (TIGR01212 family)